MPRPRRMFMSGLLGILWPLLFETAFSVPPLPPEDVLQARVRQQAVVAVLGQRALAGAPPEELMGYAAEAGAEALGAPLGHVLQLSKGGAVRRAGQGGSERASADARSQVRFVTRARGPVLISDLESEDRFTPDPALSEEGVVCGIAVAIGGGERPWGVFAVYDTHRRTFGLDDVHFVHAVANVLAAALARQQTEGQLSESEARARAVLNTTVDGVITIDDRGRITSFNPAAERIFGYVAAEVVGKNVNVLMPEPYHSEHDGYIRSYHETGRRRIIGIGREVTGQRKDGSTFPMDLAVSETDLGERPSFTGIVRDISERRRLELEVLRISDAERRRIGHDLHDDLGQQLTGIGLITRSLTRSLQREEHPMAGTAEEITALLGKADETARQLARGLVPVELGADGLPAALHRLAGNAERLFGIACSFEPALESVSYLRNPEVATHLYRIAQEAVSNAVRHGRARHIRLQLAATETRLRLRILDDGAGIGQEEVRRSEDGHGGMGVRIMHYRARIVGGSLELRPGPDGGTIVTCTIPPSSDSAPFQAEHGDPPLTH